MSLDYELHKNVSNFVGLFERILCDLGQKSLFDNPSFRLREEASGTNSLHFTVESSQKNRVRFDIFVESDGIRLDIEHTPALFEWSNNFIEKNESECIKQIKQILTGYISIETRNTSKFIQIYDEDGLFIRSASFNSWFNFLIGHYIFRHSNYQRLYLPMFAKK